MIYAILILLFVGVFAFLFWRILVSQHPTQPKPENYICPHCDEAECECHRREDQDGIHP